MGVSNIVRFNWHFYVIAFVAILGLIILRKFYNPSFLFLINIILGAVFFTIIISLLVSYYVYDYSNLYKLNWLGEDKSVLRIANIHAGFDETSILLAEQYSNAIVEVFDFYNPLQHTEISIKRAREAYPAYKNTKAISTKNIQFEENRFDKIFLFLAAHEIRNEEERIQFFDQIKQSLKPKGRVYVTEHLRDIPNFIAYNFGFLHFYSKKSWQNIFEASNFKIEKEIKITQFISTFILCKNGNTI